MNFPISKTQLNDALGYILLFFAIFISILGAKEIYYYPLPLLSTIIPTLSSISHLSAATCNTIITVALPLLTSILLFFASIIFYSNIHLDYYLKNKIMFTIIVVLFVTSIIYSPINLSFSLPLILIVSFFSALVFIKISCDNILNNEDSSLNAKRILLALIFFILLAMLIFFSPLAYTLSWPFVLTTSALGSLILSRMLGEHIVHEKFHILLLKMFLSTMPFFVLLTILTSSLPITIPFSPPFILAANAMAAFILVRLFSHPLTEWNLSKYNGSAIIRALMSLVSLVFFSALIFGSLTLASIPLTTQVILSGASVASIGALITYCFHCHRNLTEKKATLIYNALNLGSIDAVAAIATQPAPPSTLNKNCILCCPLTHIKTAFVVVYDAVNPFNSYYKITHDWRPD
jgi:hypothetical protein